MKVFDKEKLNYTDSYEGYCLDFDMNIGFEKKDILRIVSVGLTAAAALTAGIVFCIKRKLR